VTDVTIVMTTWIPDDETGNQRLEIIERALESWERSLIHKRGLLFLHVADDGTSLEQFEKLESIVKNHCPVNKISWSRQSRKGVGASLNTAIREHIKVGRQVFHAVDDWRLFSDLDLTPWISILEQDENICGFRFFPHPDLTGTIKYINPGVYAMNLDKHHFAFATRPSLWHPRMFGAYGFFEEGVSAYECERLYNEKYCRLPNPTNLWMALPDQWAHLGGVELGDITP